MIYLIVLYVIMALNFFGFLIQKDVNKKGDFDGLDILSNLFIVSIWPIALIVASGALMAKKKEVK